MVARPMNRKIDNQDLASGVDIAKGSLWVAVFAAVVALVQLTIAGLSGVFLGSVLAIVASVIYILRKPASSRAQTLGALSGIALGCLVLGGATVHAVHAATASGRGSSSLPTAGSSSTGPSPMSAQGLVECAPDGGFDNVENGSRVTPSIALEGTANICEGQTLWLFLQAADKFYVHGRQFLDISEGRWISRSGAVVCADYRPERVTYFLVATSPGVTEGIKVALEKAAIDQTAEFQELPSGVRLAKVDAVPSC
ncbi:hypothetical protein [Actinoplanes sp. NPDC051851]|uniref:hypothetical protein n=1 Tax=Actinoplanes sp. NPDC051851 TaxID=3154753 RepID=UPI003433FE82